MARKKMGPERQQWKGIDANERAFNTVRNALVGIILDGVAGVSTGVPGEERRLISPEDADRYIDRGQRVLADFESQAMAPGGARGRAQKWMDRAILELRRLVSDAEAVRAGKKPQKQTPESYAELRKYLGAGEAREPVDVDRWWSALPPGVESKIDCSDAKAMVAYLPYQGTPYDVSRSSSMFIEVCFASLKEARRFFDQAISSGHIEQAELLEDAKGHVRGRLIDDFNDSPIVGEARRYPKPKLPPRQFVAPREATRDPGCPSGSQAYMVGYIHKVSPSPQDVWGPVCLNDNAFSDSKTLGAALRKAHVLIPGGQVRQFRVEGDKVVVFPSAPGLTTYWHSIILTVGMRESHTVRDYLAIDSRDRPIAGPFKSYGDARQAAGTGGAVQFVPKGRKTSEARDDHRERSLDRLYGHTRGRDPYPFPSDRDRGISKLYGPKSGGAGAPTLTRGARRPPERAPSARRRARIR